MLLCSIYRYGESLDHHEDHHEPLCKSTTWTRHMVNFEKIKEPGLKRVRHHSLLKKVTRFFIYHLVVGYIYIVTPAKFIELDFQAWVQCQPTNHMLRYRGED